jgi:hypothetical protein
MKHESSAHREEATVTKADVRGMVENMQMMMDDTWMTVENEVLVLKGKMKKAHKSVSLPKSYGQS